MHKLATICLLLSTSIAWADADPRTQRAWKAKCAPCHGEDGKGQTDAGKKLGVADMSAPAWQKKVTDEQIKSSMQKGVKVQRNGKEVEMPAFADLKPDQLEGLLKFVRGFAK